MKDRTDPDWHAQYECDRCGACCQHYSVSASEQDIAVEPRIEEAARRFALDVIVNKGVEPIFVYDGERRKNFAFDGCCFQANDGTCGIYETRPHVCRVFKPGSVECQNKRGMSGLGSLEPVNWHNKRTGEKWYDG